ncbi:MAG: type II toxin-antitoxin system VapC family toxin [Pirellulales bacterium]|nr:type II toxin-antitoxin system VapC family toxin [Pirellulales bacterium]
MARYFLDSSALVKQYHDESGSRKVAQLFADQGNRFLVSRLALVEVRSSFARLVRVGVLTTADFARLAAQLESDVSAKILVVAALSSQRLRDASELLGTHGLTKSLRTLDAIHLATAQSLHQRTRLAAFVAADKKLLAVAGDACGLAIVDVS